MKIDVSKITDRQVMEMRVGLLQYQYMQDQFKLGDTFWFFLFCFNKNLSIGRLWFDKILVKIVNFY